MDVIKEGLLYSFVYLELHMLSPLPLPPLCASQLNSEVKLAKKELKRAQTIMQLDELKCRKRVLRRWEGRKEGGGKGRGKGEGQS